MARALIGCICLAAASLAVFWRFESAPAADSKLFEPVVRAVEAAPLCPWREPEADMRAFFPGAESSAAETRILSGMRVELAKSLGRPPEPEENALTFHRVFAGSETLGLVLTRRVKGEHGTIELVLALAPSGEVRGLRLQRMREPESVTAELRNPDWLARFKGRTQDRGWDSDDLAGLPEEARYSAREIREGVRSLLVLQAAAPESSSNSPRFTGHHH